MLLWNFPSDHQVPDGFQEPIWCGVEAFQLIIVTGVVLDWWAQMWTKCLSDMVFGALRYSIWYSVNIVLILKFFGGPKLSRQIKFSLASSNSLWQIQIRHGKFKFTTANSPGGREVKREPKAMPGWERISEGQRGSAFVVILFLSTVKYLP